MGFKTGSPLTGKFWAETTKGTMAPGRVLPSPLSRKRGPILFWWAFNHFNPPAVFTETRVWRPTPGFFWRARYRGIANPLPGRESIGVDAFFTRRWAIRKIFEKRIFGAYW